MGEGQHIEHQGDPEKDTARGTVEIVRDYTETQGDGDPILVVNPAAGNEPIILGVRVAQEVNKIRQDNRLPKAKIIVPITQDRQRRILLEESPTDPHLIQLDTQYGEILGEILKSQGNFPQHLAKLKDHYDSVEQQIRHRLSHDFQTQSLASGESEIHSPTNIIGTIDAGGRMLVDAPRRYFMFPVLLSELIAAAQREGSSFSESDLQAVAHRMRKIEKEYTTAFIPRVNTLSYQHLEHSDNSMDQKYEELRSQPKVVEGRSRIYTPAMKPDLHPDQVEGVNDEGIYAMFSGYAATEKTRDLIAAAQEIGLTVYTTPWAENVTGVHRISPDVLKDPRILAIFGRAGWGTGWQAQNLAKPWFVDPYKEGDDPEIQFNNWVVDRLGMGKVVDASHLSAQQLAQDIQTLSPGLHRLNEKIVGEFGTKDGIRFMAEEIAKDYLGK